MNEIKVTVVGGTIDEKEKKAYIDRAREKFGMMVMEIRVMLDHDDVVLGYVMRASPFERIPRIRDEERGGLAF